MLIPLVVILVFANGCLAKSIILGNVLKELNSQEIQAEFDDFVLKHQRNYKDESEKKMGFKTFKNNLKKFPADEFDIEEFADYLQYELNGVDLPLEDNLGNDNEVVQVKHKSKEDDSDDNNEVEVGEIEGKSTEDTSDSDDALELNPIEFKSNEYNSEEEVEEIESESTEDSSYDNYNDEEELMESASKEDSLDVIGDVKVGEYKGKSSEDSSNSNVDMDEKIYGHFFAPSREFDDDEELEGMINGFSEEKYEERSIKKIADEYHFDSSEIFP